MERRTALIAAAATSLALLAGAVAIGLNTQLVDASGDDGVGRISPVSVTESPSGTTATSSGWDDDTGVHGDGEDDELEGSDDDRAGSSSAERIENEIEGANDDD